MNKNLLLSIVCLTALLASCAPQHQNHRYVRHTLGTYVQLDLIGTKTDIQSFMQDFDPHSQNLTRNLYAWGDGELVQLNSILEQGNCTREISNDMRELIKSSLAMNKLSAGLFEPGVMPLVELWGFHKVEEMRASPPDPIAIETMLNHYGSISDIRFDNGYICSKSPVKVDLGGIAKGWAAKHALDLMQKQQIKNALIGFGGDLIAKGHKADGSAWIVGLKNPDIYKENMDAPAVFELASTEPMAVFTSGDYERQFEHNGKRAHHILDPRTGYPNTEVRSVTVIHHDPVLADAAATALHVAGKDWQQIANSMSLDKVLVLYPDKKAEITAPMAQLTRWLDPDYQVKTVNP